MDSLSLLEQIERLLVEAKKAKTLKPAKKAAVSKKKEAKKPAKPAKKTKKTKTAKIAKVVKAVKKTKKASSKKATKSSGANLVKQAKAKFKEIQAKAQSRAKTSKGKGSTSGYLLDQPVDDETADKIAVALTGNRLTPSNPDQPEQGAKIKRAIGKYTPFKRADVLGPGPDGQLNYKAYAYPWRCACLKGSSACGTPNVRRGMKFLKLKKVF